MKKYLLITLVAALLCGCNSDLKTALGDALIVGQEVQKVEAEACKAGDTDACKTADRIQVWLNAGQQIYDTGSYDNNCDLMLSVADIAYDWLADKYPDNAEYRVVLAILKSKLEGYCGEKP